MPFIILGERRFAGSGAVQLSAAVDGNDYFFCQWWLQSIMHEDMELFPRALSWCNIDTLFFVAAVSHLSILLGRCYARGGEGLLLLDNDGFDRLCWIFWEKAFQPWLSSWKWPCCIFQLPGW